MLMVSDRQLPFVTAGIKASTFAFRQGKFSAKRGGQRRLSNSVHRKPTESYTYAFSLKVAR